MDNGNNVPEWLKKQELEKPEKTIYIFNKNVLEIPCGRDSLMTGILCGIGSGLLTFLFTSRPKLASHLGMGGFVTFTLTAYGVCRYQRKDEIKALQELNTLMHKNRQDDNTN